MKFRLVYIGINKEWIKDVMKLSKPQRYPFHKPKLKLRIKYMIAFIWGLDIWIGRLPFKYFRTLPILKILILLNILMWILA